jgi:hypothetical protein
MRLLPCNQKLSEEICEFPCASCLLWRKVGTRKKGCEKCAMLLELYEATPKTPRLYWVMTELFVLLHGSDVCREGADVPLEVRAKCE